MKLIKYSNSMEVKIHDNSDQFVESFLRKIQEKLWNFETKSDVKNGTIEFKSIVFVMKRSDAFKILREGFVRVDKIGSQRIQILWEIKLDTTLYFSFMVGLVLGLIAAYAGLTIVFAGISGLLFTSATYFILYSIVRLKIDGIVETSV